VKYSLCPKIGLVRVVESFTTLNTGWSLFIIKDSFSLYARGPTCYSTMKGLSLQCNSLVEGHMVLICDVSRNTLSLELNTGVGVLLWL